MRMDTSEGPPVFVIARNPEEESRLPYLLRLPIQGGLLLKARDTWPRSSRVYCHPFEEGFPDGAEIIEATPVASCKRRGAVIDLVLDRPRLARSQFVFTETRGRPAIFWQTQGGEVRQPGGQDPKGQSTRAGLPDLNRHQGALPVPLRGQRRWNRAGGACCR